MVLSAKLAPVDLCTLDPTSSTIFLLKPYQSPRVVTLRAHQQAPPIFVSLLSNPSSSTEGLRFWVGFRTIVVRHHCPIILTPCLALFRDKRACNGSWERTLSRELPYLVQGEIDLPNEDMSDTALMDGASAQHSIKYVVVPIASSLASSHVEQTLYKVSHSSPNILILYLQRSHRCCNVDHLFPSD